MAGEGRRPSQNPQAYSAGMTPTNLDTVDKRSQFAQPNPSVDAMGRSEVKKIAQNADSSVPAIRAKAKDTSQAGDAPAAAAPGVAGESLMEMKDKEVAQAPAPGNTRADPSRRGSLSQE